MSSYDSKDVRDIARKKIKDRREFYSHLMIYIIINVFLTALNFLVTPDYLWFYYPLAGWGIGLTIHFFSVFVISDTITEDDIDQEIEKMNRK